MMFLAFRVQRQAAAVGVLLRFFRFGVLAVEIGEHHVERFVPEPDADGFHSHLPWLNFQIADNPRTILDCRVVLRQRLQNT